MSRLSAWRFACKVCSLLLKATGQEVAKTPENIRILQRELYRKAKGPNYDRLWDLRIAAARDGQIRTRFAFLASTVISVALLIAVFNFEFSWIRSFAKDTEWSGTDIQEEVQKDLIKNWIDTGRLNISLLGVAVGGSDASLVGSVALYILTTWFFYCIRRENHLIGRLLTEAHEKQDRDLIRAVYHGITSYTVFTTIGDDEPICYRKLQAPKLAVPHNRLTFMALVFLPVLAILLMIGTDIISLCRSAVARNPKLTLLSKLADPEVTQLGRIEFAAFIFLLLVFFQCCRIRICEMKTEGLLQWFHNEYIYQGNNTLAASCWSKFFARLAPHILLVGTYAILIVLIWFPLDLEPACFGKLIPLSDRIISNILTVFKSYVGVSSSF
jgi:hypothetical protein